MDGMIRIPAYPAPHRELFITENEWCQKREGSGWRFSKRAGYPQRGYPAPIRASLSSPLERSRARSALLGLFTLQPSPKLILLQ